MDSDKKCFGGTKMILEKELLIGVFEYNLTYVIAHQNIDIRNAIGIRNATSYIHFARNGGISDTDDAVRDAKNDTFRMTERRLDLEVHKKRRREKNTRPEIKTDLNKMLKNSTKRIDLKMTFLEEKSEKLLLYINVISNRTARTRSGP